MKFCLYTQIRNLRPGEQLPQKANKPQVYIEENTLGAGDTLHEWGIAEMA